MQHSPFTSTRSIDANLFTLSPQRLKRAKSIKDAFPPTPQRMLSFGSTLSLSRSSSRRRLARLASNNSSDNLIDTPLAHLSDLEFNFSSLLACENSDTESLPDLTDDASICGSVYSVVTPTKVSPLFFEGLDSPIAGRKRLFLHDYEEYQPPVQQKTPTIFDIPELVHKIIEYVDIQNTSVPNEHKPPRRKPLSYKHALLMHGNEALALQAMHQDTHMDVDNGLKSPNALHACLLVNKLFHRITKEVMSSRLCFSDEQRFYQFVRNNDEEFYSSFRPTSLVLNKLFCAKQFALDKIANVIDYSRLEWLEIYMCPKLLPPTQLLHNSLRSLIITGSKIMDDSLLIEVSTKCPNLQVVDLRACEGITDYGVHALATSCTQLVSVNLGRKKRGHLITDHSISTLVCNNRKLQTVGLAGCYITDKSLWELAMNCGGSVERLSLNNCPYITNQLLPVILHHDLMPKLSVLEIRFVTKITNFDPIVTFRRKQNSKGICMLVEMCEDLLVRLRECEMRMDNQISESIFEDISEWANAKDEEDQPYQQLLSARA